VTIDAFLLILDVCCFGNHNVIRNDGMSPTASLVTTVLMINQPNEEKGNLLLKYRATITGDYLKNP